MKNISTLFLLILITSCSFSPIKNVNYSKYNAYSSKNAGNQKFQEIGSINADKSDMIYTSCLTLAERALEDLINRARAMNGNALMNLRWKSEKGDTVQPQCKIAYGWFAAYIIGGLVSPWVKNVEVSAIAININDSCL